MAKPKAKPSSTDCRFSTFYICFAKVIHFSLTVKQVELICFIAKSCNFSNIIVMIRMNCREQSLEFIPFKKKRRGFPGGAVVKNLPANAGHRGSSPGLGRSHTLQSN